MPSVLDEIPYSEQVANGVSTVFGFTFTILVATDLVVYDNGAVVPSSSYSVSGVGDEGGGAVTFLVAPLNGHLILLSRELALERDTDYQYNGPFREEVVDNDFNRLWQALQGQRAQIGGAIRAPYPEQVPELPPASQRTGGYLLGFDVVTGAVRLVLAAAGSAVALALSLASSIGSSLVGFIQAGVGAVARTLQLKARESVSVLDFGADPTGVALSNAAFTAAKARCKTLLLPDQPDGTPGVYRLEGWTAQDVRLIGVRSSGANVGANEQTVIEGSGDLLVGANNFSMEHLVTRNSAAGTRGKLVTVANIDTRIGPFIDVEFRKATYHVFQNDGTKTIVDSLFRDCRFNDASIYSRSYIGGLFRYAEENCNTGSCKRGILISNTSAAQIGGVFEVMDEGAIYVTNTVTATDAIRSLKFCNLHCERNGLVTPTPDVSINVSMSLGRIEFDTCGFFIPSVAKPVDLASSPTLRISHHNCTDIDFSNVAAGTVIAATTPKRIGQTDAFYGQGGNIGTDGQIYASAGFRAQSSISVTISGVATPTPVAMPGAGVARLVLVTDATTAGSALLMLHGTATINVIWSSLATISFTAVAGVLNANTTGGAASRVLFFNFMAT